MRDCDAAAWAHNAAQLLETITRLGPEHDCVDRENLVERFREHWQGVNGTEPQIDPAGANSDGVAPRRLTQHFFGVIEAAHVPIHRETADFPDRYSRSESDLQDSVVALDIKQGDRPDIPPAIR